MSDVFENLLWLVWAILAAERLVWVVAAFMSAAAAYILHQYVEDWLYSSVAACILFASILIANFAFAHIGLVFTFDRQANVVAAAGAAVVALSLLVVVGLRVWFSVSDMSYRLRNKDEQPS
jgi:FlaA1/EpsC-like NDP-sugar epimerase